jgi:hypothetical protein
MNIHGTPVDLSILIVVGRMNTRSNEIEGASPPPAMAKNVE